MQKTLILILTTTTIALGLVCVVQWKQMRVTEQRVRAAEEAVRAQLEVQQAQLARVKELERTREQLDQQVQEFSDVTRTLRAKEARQASNLTAMAQFLGVPAQSNGGQVKTPPPGEEKGGIFGKGMGEMLGKMMKDPSMRDMMRGQQKATINMMYAGLFKELALAPEEKEKLMGILTDAQMKIIENAQGIFGEQKEGAPDTQKVFEDSKKQTDTELKALLGDERFAQYEEYQKNVGERMQLDQLKTHMESEKLPLQDQQLAQLLQAMKEEKAAVPPVIPSDGNTIPKDLKGLMTPENLDKQMQWMEDYDRRVLDRAGQILTPEQLKQYRAFQESQAAMQQFGLKMAREMFGSGKGSQDAVPGK